MTILRKLLAMALIMALASACSHHEQPDGPAMPADGEGVYIDLRILYSVDSRAETHVDEAAVRGESHVRDLTLFFLHDARGVRAPGDTRFAYKRYFSEAELDAANSLAASGMISHLFELQGYTPNAGDRALAVVNMGDLTALSTLDQLREYSQAPAWQGNGPLTGYTDFAMSSCRADEGAVQAFGELVESLGAVGTVANPYRVELSIERLAAKIDFGYDVDNRAADGSALVYPVYASDKATRVATVNLTHVMPVNVMQLPSYAIKHVTTGLSDDFGCFSSLTYCQEERLTPARPTAYVVDPRTQYKQSGLAVPGAWFGSTAAKDVTKASFGASSAVAAYLNDAANDMAAPAYDRFDRCFTLAYSNENTVHSTASLSDFLCGVLLKAQYVPAKVYDSAAGAVADAPVAGNADGSFWRYRPVAQSMPEEACKYFTSWQAAKDYADLAPGTLYDIEAYPAGECYYRVWVRHVVDDDGDAPHEPFAMEYGVVRNHIYRIGVSFSGPGSPDINIEDPGTAHPIIFVRKWNLRKLDHILM